MFLRDFIQHCASTYPDHPAFIQGAKRRSWREMHERSDRLASALQALHVKKGQVTAVLSPNRIELAEHWFACLKTGIVRAGINWRYSLAEMLHTIRDSNAKVIIVEAGCVHQIRDHIDELQAEGRAIIGFGEGHGLTLDYETLLGGAQRPVCPELSDEDWAMIGYTSGTTGMPKGAILTQRNVRESVIHNTLANEYTFKDVRLYVTNPAGINIFQMCFNVATGFTTVIDDFETTRFLELTEEHKVTTVTLVPTMLSRIVEQVRKGHYDVSSLRQVCYGTMPSTPALIRSAYDTLGCTFMQRYGVSESSGAVAALRDQDHRLALAGEPELLTSVGKPLFHADISIRDDDGKPLPVGEIGTVWIKSDTIMAGYRNLPEETADALRLPWLRTGDFGRKDERGYVFLGDRKNNMIISGGFNVYPVVVENVLAEHPAVREVVVIGMPHPEWGEAVVAAVSLNSEVTVTPTELIDLCRSRVAKWEVPKYIAIMDNLPRGNTDKLHKRRVQQMLRESGELPWVA
jgi:acyl-CoA synthetase (AMP-forming)/AMP-acid ligase II